MKRDVAIGACLVLACALFAFYGNSYALRLGTFMLMYAILAMSWNFIGGMTGYPSFASAAFFGLGAYAGAIVQKAGWVAPAAWTFGGLAALVFAVLLGLALLRLRGHYFAIASLVVAEVLREIANSATGLTGGGMGFNLPVAKMAVDEGARYFYLAMLALAAITLAVAIWVAGSRLGFGLRCIKQNETAADMIGVNTTLYKTWAFGLSAVFIGAAGAIYASWVNYIEPPDVFDVLFAVKPIVMVLLGGAGSVFGPIIGAVVFLALEELVWRNYLQVHTGVLGLLIVVLVLFLPKGLLSLRERGRA